MSMCVYQLLSYSQVTCNSSRPQEALQFVDTESHISK